MIHVISLCLLLFIGSQVFAQERLGTPRIDELHIKTFFNVREGQEVEFGFDESYLKFAWQHTTGLSTHFMLGSEQLINTPVFYLQDKDLSHRLSVVEGFIQHEGLYGRVRAGLIPIEFGEEGSHRESQLYFRRQFLFANRVVGLRDLGVSFTTSHRGYYTDLAIHNGEGTEANADSRVWFTAKWGWTNARNLNVGLSAQTGTTKPESTGTSNTSLAGFDESLESKWRLANLFTHWYPNNWKVLLELYYGSLEQDPDYDEDFLGGHFDFGYEWEQWKTFVRYDQFDPAESVEGDLQKQVSLVVAFAPQASQTAIYFEAVHKIEEQNEIDNNEARIVWRMTPFDRPSYR